MDEKTLRESIREALKKLVTVKEEKKVPEEKKEIVKESFVPREKEHLRQNRMRLHEELMKKFIKKGK